MKILTILFISSILIFTQCSTNKTGLFINLHSKDFRYALLAFNTAEGQLKLGHPIIIYLNGQAAAIADPSSDYSIKEMQGYSAHSSLKELMGKGAKVIVCKICWKTQKREDEFLLKGVEFSSPELLEKYLYNPNYKIISW